VFGELCVGFSPIAGDRVCPPEECIKSLTDAAVELLGGAVVEDDGMRSTSFLIQGELSVLAAAEFVGGPPTVAADAIEPGRRGRIDEYDEVAELVEPGFEEQWGVDDGGGAGLAAGPRAGFPALGDDRGVEDGLEPLARIGVAEDPVGEGAAVEHSGGSLQARAEFVFDALEDFGVFEEFVDALIGVDDEAPAPLERFGGEALPGADGAGQPDDRWALIWPEFDVVFWLRHGRVDNRSGAISPVGGGEGRSIRCASGPCGERVWCRSR